ncbi:MAG: YicC family protein [Clostridia bacterium]|nr:YicC family protein [Clostridia bacterium]
MIKSMTGYGRCREVVGGRDILVEVKSVNSRYIDANIKTGRLYNALEEKLKSLASTYISRGKIDIYLTIENIDGDKVNLSVNREYLESYVHLLRQIQAEYGLGGDVTVQTIANKPDIFSQTKADEDMDEVWSAVEGVARKAFDIFMSMRKAEGERMAADVLGHLEHLEAIRRELVAKAPQVVAESNERMMNRIRELLAGVQVDESRLLTECAVFADKADISEELARLDSHFAQFRSMLREDVPVGRKLDFLVQEINRECNTIGSKSSDTEFAKLVIEAKSTVEKIREQIQNIE